MIIIIDEIKQKRLKITLITTKKKKEHLLLNNQ